jgi:hypothetical protein
LLVRESAAVHFQEVTSGRNGLADAWRVGIGRAFEDAEQRHLMRMSGVLAGSVELAL